jgi:GNAT superfamily N-acetyltransferase
MFICTCRRASSTFRPVTLFQTFRKRASSLLPSTKSAFSIQSMSKKPRKSNAKAGLKSGKYCFTNYLRFGSELALHPRIPDEDDLPSFLNDYCVVHFAGNEELNHYVARFFFLIFTPEVDRNMVFPSLSLGETLAILTPDRKTVVAALTYVKSSGDAVILFFATSPLFQRTGMGSFLLSLLYDAVYTRTKKDKSISSITFYLKASEGSEAWDFYDRRGFKLMSPVSFPPHLVDAFPKEDDNTLTGYLEDDEEGFASEVKDLKDDEEFCFEDEEPPRFTWLRRVYDSSYKFSKVKTIINHRFFSNPYSSDWSDDVSVYAHLPGKLSLRSLQRCAPDSHEVLNNRQVFGETSDLDMESLFSLPPGYPPVRVNWVSRCFSVALHPVDAECIDLVIAWLQRHTTATIWKDRVTIVPVSIMRDLAMMQYLYQQYFYAEAQGWETSSGLFHPEFDDAKFMDASIPVMHFIIENKELFTKPYIAFLVEEECQHSWSCYISVNAGLFGRSEHQPLVEGPVCGYVHFEPRGVQTTKVEILAGQAARRACSFFLMLAYHFSNCEDPGFKNTAQFVDILQKISCRFGFNESERENASKFVRLSPPLDYVLHSFLHPSETDIYYSFAFLIDFCVSVAASSNPTIVWGKGVGEVSTWTREVENFGLLFELPGCGKVPPDRVEILKPWIDKLIVSMMQVIDRIAATQLQGSRTEAPEYKAYLLNKKKTTNPAEMPQQGHLFPDFAMASSWSPLPSQQSPQASPRKKAEETQSALATVSPQHVESPNKNRTEEAPTGLPKSPQASPRKKGKKAEESHASLPSVPAQEQFQVSLSPQQVESPHKDHAEETPAALSGKRRRLPTKVPASQLVSEDASIQKGSGKRNRPTTTPKATPPFSADFAAQVGPFVTEYKSIESEKDRMDMLWKVLRYTHEAIPIPGVTGMLNTLAAEFGSDPLVIMTPGEKDIVEGESGGATDIFHQRVAAFLNPNASDDSPLNIGSRPYLKDIVVTLRREGFRFLKRVEGVGWKEMDIADSLVQVQNSLRHAIAEPRQITPKDIYGKSQKNLSNVRYHECLEEFIAPFEAASKFEKQVVAEQFIDKLMSEGYGFAVELPKTSGLCTDMGRKAIIEKVIHSLRDKIRRREKKGGQERKRPKIEQEAELEAEDGDEGETEDGDGGETCS